MNRIFEFTIASTIKLEQAELWKAVATMQGVNYELAPLVSMTFPPKFKHFTIQNTPIGEQLFKSVILLFKFIPVDVHYFKLDRVVENESFEENSSSLMHHFWKHHRILTTVENGTKITDTIQFLPRLPLIGYLLKPIYQFVFGHRHKRLNHRYNINS